MAQQKRLRNLAHRLKDRASVIAASFSINRHVSSSVKLRVLRATTHALSAPPSPDHIAALLSVSDSSHSHLLPRATIEALMDRLHRTHSATVALKCLFTLHNVAAKGPFTLKDQLAYYPSYGGHNFLNLSSFRDDSDLESVQLSEWVRWYAGTIEQSLTVSRILSYYLKPSSSPTDSAKIESQERKSMILASSIADLLYKIEGLTVFVGQVSRVPESLELQRNELVYEVVRLVGEDYRSVLREVMMRLEEIGGRMENLDVGEVSELVSYLKRLEECREKLVKLFVNRGRNSGFWDLVDEMKGKGLKVKGEIEGKWLTVVTSSKATNLTRSTNPFLDPVDMSLVPPRSFATVR